MVKIKDFTLASKNLGGARAPRALHISRPCFHVSNFKELVFRKLLWAVQRNGYQTRCGSTNRWREHRCHTYRYSVSVWLMFWLVMLFTNWSVRTSANARITPSEPAYLQKTVYRNDVFNLKVHVFMGARWLWKLGGGGKLIKLEGHNLNLGRHQWSNLKILH